jgi:hypothetical protein
MSDIELRKRQVEAQLADYERAIGEYAAFMEDWRERTSAAGKRLRRFRNARREEPAS